MSGFGMNPDFAPSDNGMPKRATRQWVVENSTDLGVVQVPVDQQDGLITHAQYFPDCPHVDEDCRYAAPLIQVPRGEHEHRVHTG